MLCNCGTSTVISHVVYSVSLWGFRFCTAVVCGFYIVTVGAQGFLIWAWFSVAILGGWRLNRCTVLSSPVVFPLLISNSIMWPFEFGCGVDWVSSVTNFDTFAVHRCSVHPGLLLLLCMITPTPDSQSLCCYSFPVCAPLVLERTYFGGIFRGPAETSSAQGKSPSPSNCLSILSLSVLALPQKI